MSTNWALPSNVEQYSEEDAENFHIPWLEIDNFNDIKTRNNKSIKLVNELKHIARDPKHDLVNKTYYLKCTNFNFINVPQNISGIEVRLTMNRFGRVTDDTIQLLSNNSVIGENKASLTLEPIKIYGNNTDIWNTTLQPINIQNSTFGVLLRFQSHPRWPHSSNPLIDVIEIKVH